MGIAFRKYRGFQIAAIKIRDGHGHTARIWEGEGTFEKAMEDRLTFTITKSKLFPHFDTQREALRAARRAIDVIAKKRKEQDELNKAVKEALQTEEAIPGVSDLDSGSAGRICMHEREDVDPNLHGEGDEILGEITQ